MVKYRDPVASLVIDPIQFTLADNTYTIPALPATDWLEILLNDRLSLLDIVPGLLGLEEQDEVNLALIGTAIGMDELNVVAQDVLAVASGRDWWVTVKLVAVAGASWDVVSGEISQLGIDWASAPLGAWLDVAWHVMRNAIASGGDPKTAQQRLVKFIGDIERAPNNPTEELDEEAEAEAFMRAMQMAG